MQVATAAFPPPRTPATDRVLSRLEPELASSIPREVLDAPVGRSGSVASELERSIRVRLEGDAEPSQRRIVAETAAAVDLLASPGGARFERAIRAIASVADGRRGADDLHTITLYPDEHSSRAGAVLDDLDLARHDGADLADLVAPSGWQGFVARIRSPLATRTEVRSDAQAAAAASFVRTTTEEEDVDLSFRSARNRFGHMSIAPDVSRDLLATLGLYTPRPGDDVADVAPAEREPLLREAWRTLVHETHHSVTPEPRFDDESINVMEESIPSVFERMQGSKVARRAGADIAGAANRVGTGDASPAPGAVDWRPWNRSHLPAPAEEDEATAEGRYVDGPQLVREVLRLAGVDRRTRAGIARTGELLQAETAERVPERLAAELAKVHALPASSVDELTQLISDAAIGTRTFEDIERFVSSA